MRGFSSSGRLRDSEEGTGGRLVCRRHGRVDSAKVSSLPWVSLSSSGLILSSLKALFLNPQYDSPVDLGQGTGMLMGSVRLTSPLLEDGTQSTSAGRPAESPLLLQAVVRCTPGKCGDILNRLDVCGGLEGLESVWGSAVTDSSSGEKDQERSR